MKFLFKIILLTFFFLLPALVIAQELLNLKLPYKSGESWIVTNGYGKGYHQNKDLYALDFTLSGCDSFDKPILTTAKGKVVKVIRESDWDSFGYGNSILIQHDNGFSSRYAHLNQIYVSKDQDIPAGFVIGTAGNSGNVGGNACPQHPGTHLHFAVYKNNAAYEPKGMSGYQEFKEGNSYKSDNENTTQQTEGWKTLKDKKFSIKYPPNWKLEYSVFSDEANNKVAELAPGHLTLKNKETCKDYVERTEKGGPEIKAQEITVSFEMAGIPEVLEKNTETINNRKWSYIIQKAPTEGSIARETTTWYPYEYCTDDNGRMCLIAFYDESYPSSKKELFKQILSTFKFE